MFSPSSLRGMLLASPKKSCVMVKLRQYTSSTSLPSYSSKSLNDLEKEGNSEGWREGASEGRLK